MALNKRKINQDVSDVELNGATFTVKRINDKIKKPFDAINKNKKTN